MAHVGGPCRHARHASTTERRRLPSSAPPTTATARAQEGFATLFADGLRSSALHLTGSLEPQRSRQMRERFTGVEPRMCSRINPESCNTPSQRGFGVDVEEKRLRGRLHDRVRYIARNHGSLTSGSSLIAVAKTDGSVQPQRDLHRVMRVGGRATKRAHIGKKALRHVGGPVPVKVHTLYLQHCEHYCARELWDGRTLMLRASSGYVCSGSEAASRRESMGLGFASGVLVAQGLPAADGVACRPSCTIRGQDQARRHEATIGSCEPGPRAQAG